MPEHPLTKNMAEFTLLKKGGSAYRMQNRKIFMQSMRLRSENSGGNLQNVIRKSLQKVEQKGNVLKHEN